LLYFRKRVSSIKKRNKVKKLILFKGNYMRRRNFHLLKDVRFRFNKFKLGKKKRKTIFKKKKNIKYNLKVRMKCERQLSFKERRYTQDQKHRSIDYKKKFNTIFKSNREIIKIFFFKLKKIRQFRLSKYLSSILKKNCISFLLNLQLSIKYVLLHTKFIFLENQLNYFKRNNLIFLNGVLTQNFNKSLKVGDRLQIKLSKKFYIFSRSFYTSINKLKRKIGKRV
jgi:hypothetical protein